MKSGKPEIKKQDPVVEKDTEKEDLLQKIADLEKRINEAEAANTKAIEPKVEQTWEDKKEQMRKRDRELIAGTFRFNDVEGGHIKFTFKKWAGDPLETFLLVDGYKYALPRGVVEHLRKNCKYKSVPGNRQVGSSASAKNLVTYSRTAFDRDYDISPEDMAKLDRGYAEKMSL